MKIFAIAVLLTALYLLYRIACPKLPAAGKGDDIPPARNTDTDDGVKKSRYVSAYRRQPQPTPATALDSGNQEEKPHIFAAGNEKTDAVISPEELGEDINLDDLDIDPDADKNGKIYFSNFTCRISKPLLYRNIININIPP